MGVMGRRSSGIRRTSLRSYIRRRILTYTVGLAPKRQRLEARGTSIPNHHYLTGALNPLGACGGRYGTSRAQAQRTSLRSYIPRRLLTYTVGLAPKRQTKAIYDYPLI
ncbi:hypothetical protein Holit_01246 [Hollandina sp. SP2]